MRGSEEDSQAGEGKCKQCKAARGTHKLERVDIGTGQNIQTMEEARGTHSLERVDIRTGQDMEIKRGSKGNSPAGEGRRRDWSEHANKARQRGELTDWRG